VSEDQPGPPWVQSIQGLAAALPGLFTDRLELLALELQRASRVLLRIVALMLAATILGATAWLALSGGIALALVAWGLSWPMGVLAVLLLNLTLGWAAVLRIRRLLIQVGLPATRRHLVFGAAAAGRVSGGLHAQPLSRTAGGAR